MNSGHMGHASLSSCIHVPPEAAPEDCQWEACPAGEAMMLVVVFGAQTLHLLPR